MGLLLPIGHVLSADIGPYLLVQFLLPVIRQGSFKLIDENNTQEARACYALGIIDRSTGEILNSDSSSSSFPSLERQAYLSWIVFSTYIC